LAKILRLPATARFFNSLRPISFYDFVAFKRGHSFATIFSIYDGCDVLRGFYFLEFSIFMKTKAISMFPFNYLWYVDDSVLKFG
jgi:hypothetical protein